MRKRLIVLTLAAVFSFAQGASAASDNIETAGKIVAFGLPATAAAISLYKGDKVGLAELGFSWVATVGTVYALKNIVRERRPNGADYKSFPSDTAASGYAAAGYLWGRYGWQYGVPSYALAIFAGYSRVESRNHHWYDVAASSVIALGMNYAIVTRYHAPGNLSVGASPDGIDARYSLRW